MGLSSKYAFIHLFYTKNVILKLFIIGNCYLGYNILLCYLKLLKVAKARLCIRSHCLLIVFLIIFRVISNRKTVDFAFQTYYYTFFVVYIKKTMIQNFVHVKPHN